MFEPRNGLRRLTRTYKNLTRAHKYSISGVAAVGAAAVTFSLVPGNASAESAPTSLDRAPVAFASQAKDVRASLDLQQAHADQSAKAKAEAKAQTKADEKAKAEAAAKAKADRAKAAKAVEVKRQAEAARRPRPPQRPRLPPRSTPQAREALPEQPERLDQRGPVHHEGAPHPRLRTTVCTATSSVSPSGNPRAINLWDINASERHSVEGPAPDHSADVRRLPRRGHL